MGQQQYLADGTAAREVQWVYEPGSFRPLAQVEGKGDVTRLHYIITDLAGTARELCSEEGEVHWRGEQGLWGAHREERRPIPLRRYLGDAANEEVYCELRYQGQLYDAETGLYYNRHRYYDAESGQYISPDPIGLLGGLRPQGYVHNPLEWVDPLGLVTCPIAKLKERGFTGVEPTKNGGLDYSASNALYSKDGVNPIQTIEYTGNYHKDFEQASMAALGQKSTPKGYVWHHLDDYNPAKNTGTMQLVQQKAHSGIPHVGGVSQYKAHTGISYIFKAW